MYNPASPNDNILRNDYNTVSKYWRDNLQVFFRFPSFIGTYGAEFW